MGDELARTLKIGELRRTFLRYTRAAYQRLPVLRRPRVLDIGCGSGAVTLELAQLGDGQLVGIDVDGDALDELRGAIERCGLGERVSVVQRSFLDSGLHDEGFDLLWDEGTLHVLDPEAALDECRRLLVPRGLLVSCATLRWLGSVQDALERAGFEVIARLPWERGAWWREYYAPLEARVKRLREELGPGSARLEGLHRFEAEIRMVEQDPAAADCAHWLMRKRPLVDHSR